MKEIDGYNDRCVICLLSHIKEKTHDDLANLFILKNRYPDSDTMYQSGISADMIKRGFIERIDTRPDLPDFDENGLPIERSFSKYIYQTTEKGLNALLFGYFQSEYKVLNEQRKMQQLQSDDLTLSIKERKRNKFLSWSAFWISIAAIIISVLSVLSQLGILKLQ